MKFKHLPAPKSPKSSAWSYPFGAFGTFGGGVPVILEIQSLRRSVPPIFCVRDLVSAILVEKGVTRP
jgi:hypothetical protein